MADKDGPMSAESRLKFARVARAEAMEARTEARQRRAVAQAALWQERVAAHLADRSKEDADADAPKTSAPAGISERVPETRRKPDSEALEIARRLAALTASEISSARNKPASKDIAKGGSVLSSAQKDSLNQRPLSLLARPVFGPAMPKHFDPNLSGEAAPKDGEAVEVKSSARLSPPNPIRGKGPVRSGGTAPKNGLRKPVFASDADTPDQALISTLPARPVPTHVTMADEFHFSQPASSQDSQDRVIALPKEAPALIEAAPVPAPMAIAGQKSRIEEPTQAPSAGKKTDSRRRILGRSDRVVIVAFLALWVGIALALFVMDAPEKRSAIYDTPARIGGLG